MNGLYGPGGTTRIQRTPIAPDRLLIQGARASTVYTLGTSLLLALFFLFYAAVTNSDYWWVFFLIAIAWLGLCFQAFRYARRLGARGGYYPLIHARTVRQQTRYHRSAHPSAPIPRTPDQGRF